MYKNIYFDRKTNNIHLWDDQYGHRVYDYKKYAYIRSSSGKFKTIDGHRCTKVTNWSEEDVSRGIIYESDVTPENRFLIDKYYESDEVSKNITNFFFDIEVGTTGGYAKSHDPWQPIISIAFYDNISKDYHVLILNETISSNISKKISDSIYVTEISSEEQLLEIFYSKYSEISPDIISGWNIDSYDLPYLINRTNRVLSKKYSNLLSPIGIVEVSKKGKIKIAGVSNLDYMRLYKIFTQNEESSYSLEAISNKVLGRGKVKYDGSLDSLYRTDYSKFVEYNMTDVELIVSMDAKLDFIDLARNICHKGHVPYTDIYWSTKFLDGSCLTYLKRLDIVAINKPITSKDDEDISDDYKDDDDAKFEGAYVKDPIPGRYEYVYDLDMTGLYPAGQRSLNVSVDTKIGRLDTFDLSAFITGDESFVFKFKDKKFTGASELRNFLVNNNYSISSIGVLYTLDFKGLVPSILEKWTDERSEYRVLAKKFGESGDTDKYKYYDLRQLTMKILSNSLYGVLGNASFRFYDLDNAESTTMTGQSLIKFVETTINQIINDMLQTDNKDYVIYVDTDSTFVSATPILEFMQRKHGKQYSVDEKLDLTFKLSVKMQDIINKRLDDYAKLYHNVDKHVFSIKQEYVSEAAFWVAKKRYAQKYKSIKGVSVYDLTKGKSDYELDVKGLDSVRSSFPKAFKDFMKEILLDILNNISFEEITSKIHALKDSLPTLPIYDIMTTGNMKKLNEYDVARKDNVFGNRPKGMPVHYKAAADYNDLIEFKKYPVQFINEGDKIKWIYLKPNIYGIDQCALLGYDDNSEMIKFISENVDYDRVFEANILNKVNAFYDAMGWGELPESNKVFDFFDF